MALTTASSLSVNKAMYEQLAYFGLRPELYFDKMCTFKSTDEGPRKGVSITFTFNTDMAVATTALTDGTDGTAVAMTDTQVTLTPLEYANAIQLTAKAGLTAFYELNPVAANLIGFNAGLTMDTLACNAAIAGTKVVYGAGTTRATVTKAGVLTGNLIRGARAYMKNKHVQRFNTSFGPSYLGVIAPDIVYDFTGSTGGTNWSDPQIYGGDQSGIWNGSIGKFQGVNFMEVDRESLMFSDAAAGVSSTTQTVSGNVATLTITAHGLVVGNTLTLAGGTATSGTGSTSQVGFNRQFTVASVTDANTITVDITGITATTTAGTGTLTSKAVDVYATLIIGREGLGKATSHGDGYGDDPILGDTPVTDLYRRNTGVFWKHFVGYGVIRQDAVYRIETGSALGL